MSIYATYTPDQLENLFSSFLIDSWSFSKLSQFTRNEKAFEMQYIYGQKSKSSATTIAGNAYHFALDRRFNMLMTDGEQMDLPTLEQLAYEYIDERPAYVWKVQKTTPTVEDAIKKCYKSTNSLLKNFVKECGIYDDEIAEILYVEVYCDEWLTISGVDIPMPCHGKIDLVVRTKKGKIAIIDHKSKTAHTDEAELKLAIGKQAVTYVKLFEAKTGLHVDEVWFIENKVAQNKDGSPQLHRFKVVLDASVRRLYEFLLYEPLKRMIAAVNDPDYIYLINESDNFVDKAEMYDFHIKTMIAEVEDFNVADNKRELVAKRMRKIKDSSLAGINPKVIRAFKKNAESFIQYDLSNKDMTQSEKIEHALRTFNIPVKAEKVFDGYSSNTHLLNVGAGVKISSIKNHKLDIANMLDVPNVRIPNELVMHDGKSYVAVEFEKKSEKTLMFEPNDLVAEKIPIGKDNFGRVIHWDLSNQSTPHMLVCGGTGSGKSVCLISILEYAKLAGIRDIVILDPKFEFTEYNSNFVRVINEKLEIEEEMAALVEEMECLVKTKDKRRKLIIFGEFADAALNARKGAELKLYEVQQVGVYANGTPKTAKVHAGDLLSLEDNLRALLQKSRSVGFRLVCAAQRASAKIINGDTKANLTVQVCFKMQKQVDSIVVLDEPGAEQLAGRGDGLIKSPEYSDTIRFQSYYKG